MYMPCRRVEPPGPCQPVPWPRSGEERTQLLPQWPNCRCCCPDVGSFKGSLKAIINPVKRET